MSDDSVTPAEAFHVGEYLTDELGARGWTLRDCAERMGGDVAVDHCTLDFMIDCPDPRIHLDVKTAEGLARAFGVEAETWLNMDKTWREWSLLRAAAPDLLAACELAEDVINRPIYAAAGKARWREDCDAALQACRAAIAKAKGNEE